MRGLEVDDVHLEIAERAALVPSGAVILRETALGEILVAGVATRKALLESGVRELAAFGVVEPQVLLVHEIPLAHACLGLLDQEKKLVLPVPAKLAHDELLSPLLGVLSDDGQHRRKVEVPEVALLVDRPEDRDQVGLRS